MTKDWFRLKVKFFMLVSGRERQQHRSITGSSLRPGHCPIENTSFAANCWNAFSDLLPANQRIEEMVLWHRLKIKC